MPSIEVSDLRKTFQTKRKAEGLGGSVRALNGHGVQPIMSEGSDR